MNVCERLRKKEKELRFNGEIFAFQEDASDPYLFIVAARNTSRKRLAGGVHCGVLGRDWESPSDAVTHVAGKADNMHEKLFLHGLHERHDVDGLKVGIVCDHELSPKERMEAFLSLGHITEIVSEGLGKTCLFGGDAGVSESDLLLAWSSAPDHIVGRPYKGYRGTGETGPATAKGVAQTIDIAHRIRWQDSLERSVAVQGLGNVGMPLVGELLASGWYVTFADTNLERCRDVVERYRLSSTSMVSSGLIHTILCAVFVPCALHPIIRSDTINHFSSALRLIVSAQNDEIEKEYADELVVALHEQGKVYIPGPLANAMGIQMLLAEPTLAQRTYRDVLAEELRFHAAVVESVATQARDEKRSVYSVVCERIRLAS